MFSYLCCSNLQNLKSLVQAKQSGTTVQPVNPFDLSELRKLRYHPASKYLYTLNDENEISCLSKDWRVCLEFTTESNAIKRFSAGTSTDEMNAIIREGRVLQCRTAEHTSKWIPPNQGPWNPYETSGHWCNSLRPVYYDKWLCSDFTNLNIAIWINFSNRRSLLCASTDGIVCDTLTLDKCRALTDSPSILKIDMGYYNSLTKPSPITVSGKIFIYNDTFTLPLKTLTPITASNPGMDYYDKITPTEVMNIANFNAPRDFQLLKFFINTPSIGSRWTYGGHYIKIKAMLKLDNTILSVVEYIQPGDLRKRSLTFNGVAQSVKKGQHSLFLEFITWSAGSNWAVINEGRYRVGIEGY